MGIGYAIQGITIEADKTKVLAKLKTNREEHKRIYAEARAGYIDSAKKAIDKRMAELREGKLVGLQFTLTPPTNMTGAYDAAISALEWHTGEKISLTAQQVRSFIDDEWDWMQDFLVSNSRYSNSARAKLEAAGSEDD